nr:uncharacterized protein LOC107437716 isoform X1 [Parasteatoda tepidariorum]
MKTTGYDSITSWIATFACGAIGFLVVIPMRMAGFMFVIIIDQYRVDREKATIPIVVFGMLRSLTGPFIGYLGQVIGLRATTTLGCALASFGIGVCFFADDITTVIIGLGFIYGLGFGLGVSLVPEILKQHFSESINMPFGIYAAGGCLGGIVMPKVLQLLSEEYGNSGMLLILSAIVLNSVPAAIILKNPKNNLKNLELKTILSNTDVKNAQKTIFSATESKSEKQNKENNRFDIGRSASLSTVFPHTILNISDNCKRSYDNACLDLKDEPPDIKDDSLFQVNKIIEKDDIHECKSKEAMNLNENGKQKAGIEMNYVDSKVANRTKPKKMKSLQLFVNPTFYLTMFVQSCHGFVTTLTWTIIVDLGRDRGLSTELSLYFLMLFPVAEMIGSLGLNWITGRNFMTQTMYCMTCYLILGLVEVCLVFAHSFTLMMIFILIFGVFSGSLATTFPGMVYEFFDEEEHSMALTSRFVLYSALYLTKSPIIGYFRGTLGSYNWVLYIIAISCVLSAILVTFTPIVASWRRRKVSRK